MTTTVAYQLSLFLHILGALGLFAALAAASRGLRRANKGEEARGYLATDPRIAASLAVRVAVGLGTVFLVTFKPNLVRSLVTLVVALAAGFQNPRLRRADAVPQ
jgi:hypothetical protein